MKNALKLPGKHLKLFFIGLVVNLSSFYAFGEEKVLDLGDIEITGEVRRPNINLIYSKKYMSKAMIMIAKEELKKLEKELLKPAAKVNLKVNTSKKEKAVTTYQDSE